MLARRAPFTSQYLSSRHPVQSLKPCFKYTKMAHRGTIALSVAVLLALLEFGSCLHCFQCNSEQDKYCGDPFRSTKPAVDCATQDSVNYNQNNLRNILPREFSNSAVNAPRYCHKIVMQTGTILRTCLDTSPSDIGETCRSLQKQTTSQFGQVIKSCSVCDKDSCNGASSISFSIPIATVALIVTYLFCKQ